MRLPRLPLVTALALLFFFAYITGIRLAYSLLYALILIFVVSYFWSRLAADNLSVVRTSPEGQYQVGDHFEEQFTIENRSWIPVPLIELTDFSNLPGYDPGRVFSLKGRRTRRWTSRGQFKQRGLFTFGPVELRYGDPFGLFTRSLLDIPPNATTIREYVPTDSVKRIHWASSARLGRLMSRSFETREGGDAWIVLDLQASVHAGEAPESTLEYAMSMAASIADAALRRGGAIGLVSNDSRLSLIEAARGEQQQKKLFEHFTLAQADGTVSLATLLNSQRQQWRHRGGLIVITPSADERWLEALLDLGVRGQRSLVVYLDPRGFGGSQPSLAPAGRWRQAVNWWIIREAGELDLAPEKRVAAS